MRRRFFSTIAIATVAAATLYGAGPARAEVSLLHKLERRAQVTKLKLKAKWGNFMGATVGHLEMVGLKFPVRKYQAQVTPTLMRGSRLNGEDISGLKQKGVRTIIALTAEANSDAQPAAANGLNYLRIPVIDNTAPSNAQMKTFLDQVSKKENQPAYVHCQAGVGRTGVAVAVYRMAVDGWSAGKALAEARRYGLKLQSQRAYVRQFYKDLKAGKIEGYGAASTENLKGT